MGFGLGSGSFPGGQAAFSKGSGVTTATSLDVKPIKKAAGPSPATAAAPFAAKVDPKSGGRKKSLYLKEGNAALPQMGAAVTAATGPGNSGNTPANVSPGLPKNARK
jgi:hypothetical protein